MPKICDIIVSNFILIIIGLWVVFCFLYPTQIPTFTFTAITAGFAYQAYKYTKEKFRLELFEKRWKVYESVSHFYEIVIANKGLVERLDGSNKSEIDAAKDNAYKSFMGIGKQYASFLFGQEVGAHLAELEKYFNKEISEDFYSRAGVILYGTQEEKSHLENEYVFLKNSFGDLFKLFSPYLYFGDYKSNREHEMNLCDLRALCGEKIQNFKNLLKFKTGKD